MGGAKASKSRIRAYDKFSELCASNRSRSEIVENIYTEVSIPKSTIYNWFSGSVPAGRKGSVSERPELYYVLAALLGDGCSYRWKFNDNLLFLSGSKNFAEKYALKAKSCTSNNPKAYISRQHNVWIVRINNYALFRLFEEVKQHPHSILAYLGQDKEAALQFVEGFFDAEGCVKLVKEKVRKTPKVCLDICNTCLEYLEVVRKAISISLGFKARYSNQAAYVAPDGHPRRKTYHLRIYKKEDVKVFLENIHTTKLTENKKHHVQHWITFKNCHPAQLKKAH